MTFAQGKVHRYLVIDQDGDVLGGTDDEDLVGNINDNGQDLTVIDTAEFRTTLKAADLDLEEEDEDEDD